MQKKLLKLKQLYLMETVGVTYCDEEKSSFTTNSSLPQNMNDLKSIVHACHLCELSKTRKNVVFGEGNEKSRIMFVGEGPGAMEDESGRPFVGREGQLLTKMIESTQEVQRSAVYIANIVKCRPPENRVPSPSEALSC
jgi:DNA polymerase